MPRQRLVVQLDPPHNTRGGDWLYRTFAPGRALSAVDGVRVVNCDRLHRHAPRLLRAADVLVLNSVCDADLLPVLAERAARGAVTVFEVSDDFGAIQPWNPIYAFFQSPANVRLYKQLVRASSGMQCTVAELSRIYGHLGRQCRVFVNHLLEVPPPPSRDDARPVVVGWGGSSGHREDIARIAPALVRWVLETPGVTLQLMCADSIWSLFAALPDDRKARTPTGGIGDYYRFVGGLDVGLAPLADTGFNRSRSDVKFVEYAAHGAVAVLQDLVPYQGAAEDRVNARFFAAPDDLVTTLADLARDPAQRARLRSAAYAKVAAERRQSDHVAERLAFYASLEAATYTPTEDPTQLFDELRTWEGAEVVDRHALLAHTAVERSLHDALVLSQQDQRHDDAKALLADAARRSPSLDLPHLYAGSLYGDAAALQAALARNPRSVNALVALGRLAATQGDPARALGHFVRALELAPTWDEPYVLAAQVAAGLGATNDARALVGAAKSLAEALEAKPGVEASRSRTRS